MADQAKEVEGLVRALFEKVFNEDDEQAARSVIAPGFIAHHPLSQKPLGSQEVADMMARFKVAFMHLNYGVQEVIVSGDKAAARWVATGTHVGAFMGVAPTQKKVVVTGNDLFRVANGQLVESWVSSDFFGLFVQLGKFPTLPLK